jgi:hypothetical protein
VAKSCAHEVEYVDTSFESSSDSDESMTSGSEKTDGAEAEEETEIGEFQFDSDAERQSTADDDGDMAKASEGPPTFRAPEIILLGYPGSAFRGEVTLASTAKRGPTPNRHLSGYENVYVHGMFQL